MHGQPPLREIRRHRW